MSKQALSYLTNQELENSRIDNLSGDEVERFLQEYVRRNLHADARVSGLFRRLIHSRLEELECRYVELKILFSKIPLERKPLIGEVASVVSQFLDIGPTGNSESPADGDEAEDWSWPWPITEVEPTDGGELGAQFPHERSGLKLCGYTVGQSGREAPARRRFLTDFFGRKLPEVVEKEHGNAYGTPGSSRRLKKMADVIANNCKNFKRRNPHTYKVAIRDYEADLEFLKQEHYDHAFEWPTTIV